ncbi:MAG: choice-of-anchor Q domain-containing protein [Solirubrobacterales bacterium]
MRKLIPVVCAAMVLSAIAPAMGLAATFKVNTPEDTTVAGGCTTEPACSLRDALLAAAESTDPESLVILPAGNYTVSEGPLRVGGNSIAIRGEGARATVVDAHQTSRVFELDAEKVAMEGLTVTGGSTEIGSGEETLPGDGGGIVVVESEELTLNAINVFGNRASQNGGGIAAPPENSVTIATNLSIANSTIAGNHVTGGTGEGLGGGIYALGSLSLVNSTVSGNSAEGPTGTSQGGGIVVGPDGVNLEATKVTLLNATIAGNSVGTGGVGGGLAVYNPAMGLEPSFTVRNTIVAGNTVGGTEADCGAASLATSDHNISGDASCMFTDPSSKQNANPQLGALQNNGGETDTMALLEGSPAVDAGSNEGCPATDQRGVTRPQGSACDVGAFELVPKPAAAADLRLRLRPKPKHPQTSRKLTFLMTVSNRGPSEATGVVVKGTVPALTKKVSGKEPCKLAKAKGGKRKLTCQLGAIAAGKATKLRIVVRPGHAGKLRARARVRSGVADPNLKDNHARATAKVVAR